MEADRAVVGRDPRVAQQPRALGVRRVAEAEQRRRAERVLPDRERRDPDAAADEQRAALAPPARGSRRPSGPSSHSPSPARSSHSRRVPGPTSSKQEVERAVLVAPQDRERARQERPLVGAPAPALARGEHVELARLRQRAVGVEHRHDVVGAVRGARPRTGQSAPPERRERAVAHAFTARRGRGAWRSWSETHLPARRGAPRRSRAPPPCRPRAS